jgi:endonuclease YncB( thermonuclease family)
VFWWRKRNEGFEWRDYVRTTILVRREQRRQRIKDVQDAAVQHVKVAGRRGVEASVEGARVASRGAWSRLKVGSAALARGAARTLHWLVWAAIAAVASTAGAASRLGRSAGGPLEPVLSIVRRQRVMLVVLGAAVLAGLGALTRWYTFGADGDVYAAAGLSAVLLVLLLLAFATDPARGTTDPVRGATRPAPNRDSLLSRLKGGDYELPESSRLPVPQVGLAVAVLGLVAAGGASLFYGVPHLVSLASTVTAPAVVEQEAERWDLEGRATAVSGDRLRVAGRLVALEGIEAPEAGQSCERKSGRWRCGAAAREELAGLVRRERVSCEVVAEEAGETVGRCFVRGEDIAEHLVRDGHVFATGGFLSSYASVEGEAQDAQRGLWAGAVERPQDYRDKRWEEAKKAAPDGCPIKGRVRRGARVYVLPWSPSYKGIRVSKARGERWFCSESEAQAAGWTRSTAS